MSALFPDDVINLATSVLADARAKGIMIATAESCTGGLIAGALTAIAGSSDVVDRGFVTYSNQAKMDQLGVSPALLKEKGAVSAETASAMAGGALSRSGAQLTISVTGVAGPSGGSPEKPVGLVYVGLARADWQTETFEYRFGEIGRDAIRLETVRQALSRISDALA